MLMICTMRMEEKEVASNLDSRVGLKGGILLICRMRKKGKGGFKQFKYVVGCHPKGGLGMSMKGNSKFSKFSEGCSAGQRTSRIEIKSFFFNQRTSWSIIR